MNLRPALLGLLSAALALPIVTIIMLGAGRLLAALDDRAGAVALDRIALAAALLWVVDLVAIVVLLALDSLRPPPNQRLD